MASKELQSEISVDVILCRLEADCRSHHTLIKHVSDWGVAVNVSSKLLKKKRIKNM